jgi:hypothetical protein
MMPDGDTAAHLRKQVGGLFLGVSCVADAERCDSSAWKAIGFVFAA